MTERNVVRQYIQRAGSGVTKVGLAATLALSMTPALAIAKEAGNENAQEAAALTATNNDATASEASKDAQTSSSSEQYSTDGAQAQSDDIQVQSNTSYDLAKIADGTYTGTAEAIEPDGEEWEISSYTVEVEVKVSSHKIESVKVADKTYDSLGNGDSADYLDKAENGKRNVKGVAAQIAEKNTTSVDVVSNATVSSKAIMEAADNALQAAYDAQNPVVDEYTYGFAALTWAEYWAAEGVYNASDTSSSDEVDRDAGNGVYEYDRGGYDVVTRATSNHGLHRGSFQCSDVIETAEGVEITPSYYPNKTSFVDASGTTWSIGSGKVSDGVNSYTITGHKVTGIKYVPVKVKTADLEAFKAQYSFVANGETIQGGFTEGVLTGYSGVVADVNANTNGLKEVSLSGDSFSFGKAATGTDSGIKDQSLKSATDVKPSVVRTSEADTEKTDTFHTGSFGEFLRVDINGDYGDLGANMQSVTWTYYGDDSTRTTALATYGTKFAADNWMHKSMGIQLGLTESARCQLPSGTDGTGYWKLTVHALGYEDYTYEFEATADNIAKTVEPVTEETKQKLQDLYDEAVALNKDDYTAESWEKSAIETETAETKGLLTKEDLGEAEASEQLGHLQDAIDALDAYVYGYAGLTWAEYWASEDVQAAGSSESSDMLDSRDESDKGAFDVVTRATTNHGMHRGSFQCLATVYTEEGRTFEVSTWDSTGNVFTTTDGEQVTKSSNHDTGITTLTCGEQTYTFKDYEVSGLKYVPVKIASSQLEAFGETHQFVANDGTLVGGYTEKNLKAYSVIADVDATTNGLKTVTAGENGSFTFSAAAAGEGSGIKDQAQKTADLSAMGPVVKDGDGVGSYGEFLRVDFTENYGDLGSNLQTVTWTYYGDDSTRTTALATYGTKFAADNWMHKSMGIQLGLTESARCQLPSGTDGTGYWKLTVHALGYEDYTYEFEATADNIAKTVEPVTEETKQKLQDLYDEAVALNKDDYTAESWEKSAIETETAETKGLLTKEDLGEAEASEQLGHLQDAIDALDAYVYGYAGLTWAEYWASEDVQAAGSSESSDMLDSRDESDKGAFDVVTRATTNHGMHRGSFQCLATVYTEEGRTFEVSTWDSTGNVFTTTDGEQVTKSSNHDTGITTLTCGEQTYTFKDYEVSGLKYVPVKIASSQLEAFGETHQFVANDGTLVGGYTEKNLKAYSVIADVDATTNGLKTVTAGENGSFTFSAAAAGEGSGIKDQAQKTADLSAMGPVVKDGDGVGSYGEFLRVDFTENYGDLGSNLQTVTWTYYGNDSTRTTALATYGTKFAADNWMHKSMSIQLGLTESIRCQLPAGTDGTGYWTITVRALGYADASYDFEATAENIADHTLVTDATKAELQKLVDEATATLNSIDEALYTEKSVSDLKDELEETIEMLAKSNLEETAAAEQKTHLSEALEGLTLAPATEATLQKLNDLIANAEDLNESDYSSVSWQVLSMYLAAAKQAVADADLTEQDAREQITVLEAAINALEANPRIALNEAIDAASALQQGDYTKASWEPFASALAAAQAVAADSDADDDEVSLACQALVDAQAALAKAATTEDRSNLDAEISKADGLKESDYTAESWKAYQAALAAAKKAAAAEDPSSAELQEATANLAAARAALAKPSAEASQSSADQNKADKLAQTSDSAATFAVAAGFAAFIAFVGGAFAAARRRLFNK